MTTKTRKKSKRASTGRRSKYSPAKIAEFRAADAAMNERADAALNDPTLGARVVAALGAGGAFTIGRYSARNQGLILELAADYDLDVSGGVATYRQWKEAGRAVRKEEFERPLFISRPVGRAIKAADAAEDGATAQQETAEDDPVQFRTMKVYSFQQTEGAEDFAPQAEMGPQEVLLQEVRKQFGKAGYTVAAGEAAFDFDSKAVTIPDEPTRDDLEFLVNSVASVTAANRAATRARQAAKADRRSDVEEVDIEL